MLRILPSPSRLLLIGVTLHSLFFSGCQVEFGEPLHPTEVIRESEHFTFIYTSATARESEVEEAIQLAEALFRDISSVVGIENTPSRSIQILLEGDYRDQGPYVDSQGGLRLFRYRAKHDGYLGLLAHELTHAFRYEYWQRVNGEFYFKVHHLR